MIRKLSILMLFSFAAARADVVTNTFEVGADSLLGASAWGCDSCKVKIGLDSANPISGKASARLDYVLDPQLTSYPYVGAHSSLRGMWDLRAATGIRVKFRSSTTNRTIHLKLESNWYPIPHISRDVRWQWDFNLPQGDLDTILYFADVVLSAPPSSIESDLAKTIPKFVDILQGVSGITFDLFAANGSVASATVGTLIWDELSIVGVGALTAGSDPKILGLRDYSDSAISAHPDSVPSTWHWGNARSAAVVSRNRLQPAFDSIDIRCDYTLANNIGSPWSAYAGCGVGFRGDSAWDMRGTFRWEFAQNAPVTRKMRIDLTSSRYPQELIDSGVTYGWNTTFDSTIRWWEGTVVYTDSLKPPTWAAGHPRLLAMLPPVDSILKGITGINLSPVADFLADGSVNPATATSFFQVNHFLAIGIDQWIPSPPKPKDSVVVPPKDTTKSVLLRAFEIGGDSLRWSGVWANDSSTAILSLDSAAPLSGKTSARLDYVLNPKTTAYPYAGTSSAFLGTYDLRNATGIRIKLRSLVENTTIRVHVGSKWYPLPHLNRSFVWLWDFPVRRGELDTTLYFSQAALPPISSLIDQNLASTVPRVQDILQGANEFGLGVRSSNEPIATSVAGSVIWDDIAAVGTDTLLPGNDPKILVLRDYDDSAIASQPDSVPNTWHWSNSKSSTQVHSNSFQSTWNAADIRCDYSFANDTGSPWGAYGGCGVGFRGDSAWDMRGVFRWEFAQNVPVTRKMRIDLTSNRYPKELVDSGFTYGWNATFNSNFTWWEGAVLYTDSLKPPTWSVGHTRLLALLPPIDSILKGVTGINFSPTPDFLSDGSVNPATATSFFQVNHFLAIGIDQWLYSPANGGGTASLANPFANRPWSMRGQILTNTGNASLELLDLRGRLLLRVEPGSAMTVPKGFHLIRQAGSTRGIVVP